MQGAERRPRISLIVCTRNRAARLPQFLDRLSDLQPVAGGWELILVDNGSTDATPDLLDAFARSAAVPVRIVRAPRVGLAAARNVGLAEARGDVLAFTDDDCYPRADYLPALIDVFDEHGPGFVGGRVVLHDPTDVALGVRDVAEPTEIPPRTFIHAGVIHGANMAVSREVLDAIGGFDTHLGVGTSCVAGEDIEYLARASWAGWWGRYDPRPVVAHHHGRKPGVDAARQRRGYDYGRGAYYARFVLDPRSRRMYLTELTRQWYWAARRGKRMAMLRRLRRELTGAARYVVSYVLHPEARPRFSVRRSRR